MTPDGWLREAVAVLAAADIPDPAREARVLWRSIPNEDGPAFLAKVRQRASRVPLSHVLGYRDFYKHRFIVTGDVLDPRPDTETLIEAALAVSFQRVLDLGTGSGCILLSLLDGQVGAIGVGTDISEAALGVARRNGSAIGVGARAAFVRSDWFEAVEGTFDLIVSNPPYIAVDEMAKLQPEVRLHEPRIALTDEADGLSAYRAIVAGAADHLSQGGRLIFEIGPTQAKAVTAMLENAGFVQVAVIPDLDGRDRVVQGFWPGPDAENRR